MKISDELRGVIRKYAIKNAIDYGKAEMGSVLGKVIPNPAAKGLPVPILKQAVEQIIAEVNKMSKAELEKEYNPFVKEFEAKAKETAEKSAKPNMTIDGAAKGKVFTRYPPEPGGYMTLGNAKQCIISEELARMYGGKIYLYFDDTNPEKCKQEYVDGIKRDTAWLGAEFGKEYYASDYIEKEYDICKKLIKQDHAYVCLCIADEIKKNRFAKVECKHRHQKPAENLSMFEEMLNGKFEEGQAVARLKGDMKSENTTLRDPAIFRIKKAAHYRQGTKYIVWPTYHINTPLIDNFNGITDVIRGKEYEIFDASYKLLLEYLKLKAPRMHYPAMLQIKGGMTAHKRELRKLMKEGLLERWDDPRLLTVMAMRRRGIQPQAIRDFILRFGMSKTDAIVSLDMLLAENKKIIDPIAKHLYFVPDPVRLTIKNAQPKDVKMRLHPSNEFGHRYYKTSEVFHISEDDAKTLKPGQVIRLKDFMDVKIISKTKNAISTGRGISETGAKIIQWVSDDDLTECSVLVPGNLLNEKGQFNPKSLQEVKGYVESYAKNLNEHDIVQFERFGYCILDNKKKMQFIFISK